jgi:signal transduction histidine kinase
VNVRGLIAWTFAAGALATVLISIVPFANVAYKSHGLHVAIETTATLVAFFAAYLTLGRFKRSRQLSDLLLLATFALVAATNLFLSTIPALPDDSPGRFDTWASLVGVVLGSLGLVMAAFAPRRTLRSPDRAILASLGGAGLLLALATAGIALLGDSLPVGIDPELTPVGSGRPRIVGSAELLAVQILGMLALTAAGVGFGRRASRSCDELMAWLAAACVLAAFARLNYFMFPPGFSHWTYAGDFLRLGGYVLLLAGTLREVRIYQRQIAAGATLEERGRLARELHDGVAQDLAVISSESRRLAASTRDERDRLERLALVADRALGETRQAIGALRQPDESLRSAVARAVEEVAGSSGASADVDVPLALRVSPHSQHSLVRIVREATLNALRHGGATRVEITLSESDGIELTIRDNGAGFLAGDVAPGSFGLVSMRQRAEQLGGELRVNGASGAGTVVTARLPAESVSP